MTGWATPAPGRYNGDRQYEMVSFNVSQVLSKNFASTFYNCYSMLNSAYQMTGIWLNSFVDFSDVYTSFLFNLLSQSMKLKTLSASLQTA